MNMKLKTTAQGGFTLIELIVVIVILGILAATALPKFASLGGDARVATLNAARGSMSSVVMMAHGKYLVNPTAAVTFEGTTVTMTNGYPAAAQPTVAAAGLGVDDFTAFFGPAVNAASATAGPVRAANQIAIVPKAVVNNTNGYTNCYLMYTEATSATTPPIIALGTNATADNCQ